MKIEVGKKYKTRNGKTVFIHSVTRKNTNSIVGEFLESSTFYVWGPDGCFESGSRDGDIDKWDLVSEVKEKLSITFEMDIPEVFQKIDAKVIENACKNLTGGFKCSIYGTPLDTKWFLSELHHSEIKISLSDYKP